MLTTRRGQHGRRSSCSYPQPTSSRLHSRASTPEMRLIWPLEQSRSLTWCVIAARTMSRDKPGRSRPVQILDRERGHASTCGRPRTDAHQVCANRCRAARPAWRRAGKTSGLLRFCDQSPDPPQSRCRDRRVNSGCRNNGGHCAAAGTDCRGAEGLFPSNFRVARAPLSIRRKARSATRRAVLLQTSPRGASRAIPTRKSGCSSCAI